MPLQMEFDGKDVESAVEKASKKLNIPVEKLKYAVISYGSTGIFGLVGVKKARIRVTAPGSPPGKSRRSSSASEPAPPSAAETEQSVAGADPEPDAPMSEPDRSASETAADPEVPVERRPCSGSLMP